jgi:hypothetical protein
MLEGMRPRIEIQEVRLRTGAGSHTDHFEAVYIDSSGREICRGEHPEYSFLAFSTLQQTMKREGFRIEDLPQPYRLPARYVGSATP